MEKTNHAEKRMQQRGFSDSIIDIIINSGRQEKAPGGGIRIIFGAKEYSMAMYEINNCKKLLDRAKNGTVIIKENKILSLYKKN